MEMNSTCVLCEETILSTEDTRPMGGSDGPSQAHRECLLRAMVGGIGHLEDHYYWCIERGDPNGGRTYRQSAIEVEKWVHDHGLEEATHASER